MKDEYEIIFVPNEGRAIKDNKTNRIYYSEFQIIKEKNEEIKRLKEEYMILQNASDEVEEEKDREIERLNNIINELEKELINCIKEAKLKWGNQLTDKGYLDIQMTVKNYEDVLNKLQELKGSDKE